MREDSSFCYQKGQFSLLTLVFMLILRPTQPPTEWVPVAISSEVKRPYREAVHSPPSSADTMNQWSFTSNPTPIFVLAVLIIYLRTGTISPLLSPNPLFREVSRVEVKTVWNLTLRFHGTIVNKGRSQWPRGLGHELSSLGRMLGTWVRIPLKAWMSVLCAFILCSCCSACS
jgi:hypothetical protein